MSRDAFSQCHPLVNFLYLAGAIGFGVVIQHPAYILAGIAGSTTYYLTLKGAPGMKFIVAMLPLALIIGIVNPLLNTKGATVLFLLLGRPYTLEALAYGLAIGGIFLIMMLWFGCYSEVLTSDKFTSLFGNLIPALSLLLVMVLRLIPSFARKARQIAQSRKSIGKSPGNAATAKEKTAAGMSVVSALADWALEGSVATADSMRSRGYGCSKRTAFQTYRMDTRDGAVLGISVLLAACVLLGGGKAAEFVPVLTADPLNWSFVAYCAYLLIPTALHIKEALTWRILQSRI
ncbi:MAG: hypothetical protein IJC51_00015 [Eggerthellaceae bacterium]|nr:hypothetical protein [Eggerthellaceae bacterium]